MLVDPVAGDAVDGALVPPLLGFHLLVPGARDVPVVAHVVVVPGHRDRDGREEPADQRVAPGLFVEPGVLLEVEHVFAGWLADIALGADLLARARRALVDVDLVAEQEEQLGPLAALWRDHLRRQHAQGVELMAVFVLVLGERVGLLVGDGHPAGAEADVDRLAGLERADRARRQVVAGAGQAGSPSRATSYS